MFGCTQLYEILFIFLLNFGYSLLYQQVLGLNHYFLRMVKLYSDKVCDLQVSSTEDNISGSISYLKSKEKMLLKFLLENNKIEFTPVEISKELSVTNKTIINRLATLVKNGFVVPILANKRIMSYKLTEFAQKNKNEIISRLNS